MIGEGHVVIAGGVGRLGLALAERLLDEGASVTVLDADAVEIAVSAERFAGEDILFLECDVSDEEQVADCLAQASAGMGPVSGLVNCADFNRPAALERTGVELFRQIVEVNLTGTFITCKAVLDAMDERLAIVNVSAAASTAPVSAGGAYGAAKAGVNLMSRVLARELGDSGVRVNVVLPPQGEADEEPAAVSPGDRQEIAATPVSDIVAAIVFLLSEEAAGISGQVIAVRRGGEA